MTVPTDFTFAYSDDTFAARIVDTGEGYELAWTDYVANDWSETYPNLDAALSRLALLIRGADRGFVDHTPTDHHLRWEAVTEEALYA